MKKILSILLASAVVAFPLATGAVHAAESREASCGIANALESVFSSDTYGSGKLQNLELVLKLKDKICNEKGENTTDCANLLQELLKKLSEQCGGAPDLELPELPDMDLPEFEIPELPEESLPDTEIPEKPEGDLPDFELPGIETPGDQPENNTPDSPETAPSDQAAQVIDLVNAYRAQYGLSALSYDEAAAKAAQVRAFELTQLFSHTRPNGTRCFTALDEAGANYRGAGENIAMGQSTAQQVMNDWMNSEGHRANILNESFTRIGVGLYVDGNGRCYWAQEFIS